jgi:hypothetical protein
MQDAAIEFSDIDFVLRVGAFGEMLAARVGGPLPSDSLSTMFRRSAVIGGPTRTRTWNRGIMSPAL